MKRKKLLLLTCLCTTLTGSLYAQSVKRQVISPTGGSSSSGGVFIQETTGQPYSTKSYSEGGTSIRQGFQQPSVFTAEIIDNVNIEVGIYPNPSSYFVTIESKDMVENATLQVLDISGKVTHQENIKEFTSATIDCRDWANGTFIILITSENGAKSTSKLIINK
jgi:hypothetical protein